MGGGWGDCSQGRALGGEEMWEGLEAQGTGPRGEGGGLRRARKGQAEPCRETGGTAGIPPTGTEDVTGAGGRGHDAVGADPRCTRTRSNITTAPSQPRMCNTHLGPETCEEQCREQRAGSTETTHSKRAIRARERTKLLEHSRSETPAWNPRLPAIAPHCLFSKRLVGRAQAVSSRGSS